ncbi:MAG: glycosyltransferase family 87 protein [Pseudomonadales bacterium]
MNSITLTRGKSALCFILILTSIAAIYLSLLTNSETVGSYLDFQIFTEQAKSMLATGQLYERDLSLYGPGSAVYKYPPLYGSLLALGLQQGLSVAILGHIGWLLQIICWFAAFIIIYRCSNNSSSNYSWLLLSIICTYWFANDYFRQNAYRLQLEPYILLILSLALHDFIKNKDFRCGFWIGLTAALKVYTLFMLPLFVLSGRWRSLAGAFLGIISTLALTLPILEWREHTFYLLNVFPVLMQEGVSGFSENISIARMLVPYTMLRPNIRPDFPQLFTHSVAIVLLAITAIRMLITKIHMASYTGASIDFAAIFSIMLIYMPNFWWNYQILNLLPGTVAACLCLPHYRRYLLPLLLLTVMLIAQIAITIPELWQPKFSDAAFDWLGDPNFIIVRGSIQIFLVIAVLLSQLIFHHRMLCNKENLLSPPR